MVSKSYNRVGLAIAGSYMVLAIVILLLNWVISQSDFWGTLAFIITFPISLLIVPLMWGLAHNNAMYLVTPLLLCCASLNAMVIYFFTSLITRRNPNLK